MNPRGIGKALTACLVALVILLASVAVIQQLELAKLANRSTSQQPSQGQMPPYILEFGSPTGQGYANPSELDGFARRMTGPDSPLMPYGRSELLVAWGEGADGYYWVWVDSTRSGAFFSNSSQIAEIENVVSTSTKAWGYPDLIPLKMAVGTGLGGYDFNALP